jgi:DNA-binding beta-propeller fold protein YncE
VCVLCPPGIRPDATHSQCVSGEQQLSAAVTLPLSQDAFLAAAAAYRPLLAAFFGVDPTQLAVAALTPVGASAVEAVFTVDAGPAVDSPSLAALNAILAGGGLPVALDIRVVAADRISYTLASCVPASNTTPTNCPVTPLLRAPLAAPGGSQLPHDVLLVPSLSRLYLTLPGANALYTYSLTEGALTAVFAGTGPAGLFSSPLQGPTGLALSPDGGRVLVADTLSHCLRSFAAADPAAGLDGVGDCGWPPPPGPPDGPRPAFSLPVAVRAVRYGAALLVLDRNRLLEVDVAGGGAVRTVAGGAAAGFAEGAGADALFNRPAGLAAAALLPVAYVADSGNHAVRRVDLATGAVTLLAGSPWAAGEADGVGSAARFRRPCGVALSPDYQWLFVTDSDAATLRSIAIAAGDVRTLAPTPPAPCGLAVAPLGTTAYVAHAEGVDLLTVRCSPPGFGFTAAGGCMKAA